ncbi:MAG: hypothetical protein K2X98_06085 [Alphaproteobacteria bacterium]|nr:hypothetical protein [Alphaproteobacteria bacterium]
MLKKCLQAFVIVIAVMTPCHTRSFSDIMPDDDINFGQDMRHFGTELRQGVWKKIIQPSLVPLHIVADVASFVVEKSKSIAILRLGTLAGMVMLPQYENPLSLFAIMVHFHADYNLSVQSPDSPNNFYYQTIGLISGGYLLADYYYRISPAILNKLERWKNSFFTYVDDHDSHED